MTSKWRFTVEREVPHRALLGKYDAVHREEHTSQKKQNPEDSVPAYEQGASVWGQAFESLRSPNPGGATR